MKLIDLSHSINNQTPLYPGDPEIKITQAGILEKDGYEDHVISLSNHQGTHIDVPSHMVKGGKSLDQFPIEKFCGKGVYIKVDGKFDLVKIKNVNIEKGDIVLFHTGRSEHYHEPDYFEQYPVMNEEIADYLASKGAKIVGLDTCSADKDDKSFPIHKTLLRGEVLIIENLTNLAELEGEEFRVYALPLKLEIDGAPARVVAEVI